MGYLLLAATLLSSVVAFRWWLEITTRWVSRRQGGEDIADISLAADWPGLIAAFLPRKPRRAWNALVLAGCVFLLGFPHWLVIWNFFRPGQLDPWYYFHYLWTLIYWLALLGCPALFVARHRLARLPRRDGQKI